MNCNLTSHIGASESLSGPSSNRRLDWPSTRKTRVLLVQSYEGESGIDFSAGSSQDCGELPGVRRLDLGFRGKVGVGRYGVGALLSYIGLPRVS